MTVLRRVDLNLLVALDAMLRERHVTRAAQSIALSQPAMSSALARLRLIFGDDLFVRTATGMQPTPRAEALIEPVRQTLAQVERLFEPGHGFVAASSTRRYLVRLSDLLGQLLLPRLMHQIGLCAPRVALDVVHLPPNDTADALERDELDVAVSMGLEHSASIRRQELFRDRMVCVMRDNHPLAEGKLTLPRFLSVRHLTVSMSSTDTRFVDDALSRLKARRDIALNVPHWLLAGPVLASTDCVAVVPRVFAAAIKGQTLVERELPFGSKSFAWCLYWHRRNHNDPANNWLRAQILEACGALSAMPPAAGRLAQGTL